MQTLKDNQNIIVYVDKSYNNPYMARVKGGS